MAAARASTDPRDRLVVELLARTGMRAGELADLEADAVVQIGGNHWLRIPLGKLRLSDVPCRALGTQHRMRSGEIVRQGIEAIHGDNSTT